MKDSGLGRSHSKFRFYECVNVKQLTWDPALAPNFWWHPYDGSLGRALHSSAQLLYGRDDDKAEALRRGAPAYAQVVRKVVRGALRR